MRSGQKAVCCVLVLFVCGVLAGCGRPVRSRARQAVQYTTVAMQMVQLRVACEVYASYHGQFPFSPQGSDEALRLAIRTAESLGPEFPSEKLYLWLQYRWTGAPGEVDYLYLNDPDAGRLPRGSIILVEKSPIRADGRLHVAPWLGDGPTLGQVYLIDSRGLSPAEVLGQNISEFSVSPAPPPEEYACYIRVHMEHLRFACECYAQRDGQYPFSPQGSDEALRLFVRSWFPGGDVPSVLADLQLQYRSTSAPGEVDYLYLNDPDAGRLPVGTIMLVEKRPIRPDGRLYVAPRRGWEPVGGHVYLIDPGGLSPTEVLGRNLSEFPASPAF